jgi:lysophospholipid hydrolase
LAHDANSPRHGAAKWLEHRPSKRRPRLAHYRLDDDADADDATPAIGVRKNCGALFYASRLRDLQHEAKMERYDADADARRLARLIAGRAVGVVLGGGGSRGLAHLGVLASLEANGVEIDMLGGCSQGAYMGAAYAAPSESAVRCRAVRKAAGKLARALTSPMNILADLTIPILSFFHGARFTAAVRRSLHLAFEYEELPAGDVAREGAASWHASYQTDGRRRARSFAAALRLTEASVVTIEDSWLTYFCVSTNLSSQSCAVHDSGPLARWVRASMSVAEFLPPVRDPETNMLHADGCYVNNLPVDIMKRDFGAHVVIGVSVVDTSGSEFDGVVAYGEDGVSGLWLLLRRCLNFCAPQNRTVPTMGDIRDVLQILRNRTQLREARRDGLVDLFLEIEPVKNSSAATYWRLERVAALARDYADPRVRDWLAVRADATEKRRSAAALRGRGDGAASRLALPALRSVLHLSRAGGLSDLGSDSQSNSANSADSLRSAVHARRSGRASFFSADVY